FVPVTIVTAAFLVISLLELDELKEKTGRRVFYSIAIFACIGFVARLFGQYNLGFMISNLSSAAICIVYITYALRRFKILKSYMKTFLIGIIFFAIGVSIFVFKNLGLLPYNHFTNYSMITGSALEMVLLAVAVYQKVNELEILRKSEIRLKASLHREIEVAWDEHAKAKKKAEEFEFTAVMNNFNPHFAFNALGSISSCIANRDYVTAEKYLAEFAIVMRTMLINSEFSYTPLVREIKFLRSYLELEKLRLKSRLNYVIYIDPQIDQETTFVPTIILQPLLENAIKHGIFHRGEKGGTVTLEFRKVGGMLEIKVIDDGVGLNRSKEINKDRSSDHKSVAMDLITKRLIMDFGSDPYPIEIESTDDVGTTVTIRIPFPEAGDYDEYLDLMDFD
ncbi:MAG: histidine kinase, partial [Flavobacteriales bacterium]|nr:histidine kinase [Flavobacteriales bacterium]